MNLIVDVGNTRVKLAVFQEDKMLVKTTCNVNDIVEQVLELQKEFNLKRGILASVGKLTNAFVEAISAIVPIIIFTHKTKVPFKNAYKTPETLGVDRIALVGASVKSYPKSHVLIIDAGTCITYDFIDSSNTYHGGAISPGLTMRYKSLNNLTANLPLLKRKTPKEITGNTSKRAIHSGVVNGVVFEIDGVINQYREKYQDLTVILTGGDTKFLSKQLKNSIFANSNFLLEGLNFILEFNSCE